MGLVSGEFSVPKSAVNDIWKGREKLESYVSARECPSLTESLGSLIIRN